MEGNNEGIGRYNSIYRGLVEFLVVWPGMLYGREVLACGELTEGCGYALCGPSCPCNTVLSGFVSKYGTLH